jgi:hypothetical protein
MLVLLLCVVSVGVCEWRECVLGVVLLEQLVQRMG